tara:strand:+ start:43 stop:687 length:645 start_codon:yes stop_codon:yes gene_type:complete
MIPNLANAATSNKDLYLKKKKKKKNENRFSVPNLANAATSKSKKTKSKKSRKASSGNQELSGAERAKAMARKRIAEAKAAGKSVKQIQDEKDAKRKSSLKIRHADWKKMRKGEMSKSAFVKKYPNSNTAKESGSTTQRSKSKPTSKNGKSTNKRTQTSKPLTKRQFIKKFGIEKGDTEWRKFRKSGALSGFINRRLKKLRNMSKEDLTIKRFKK